MFCKWSVVLSCFAVVGLAGWVFAEQKGLAVFQKADGTIEITAVEEGAATSESVGSIKADGIFVSGAPAAHLEAKQGPLYLETEPFALDPSLTKPSRPEKSHFHYFYNHCQSAASDDSQVQNHDAASAGTPGRKLPPDLDATRELAELKALLLDVELDRKHKELLLDVMTKMQRMQTTLELSTPRPSE